MPRAGFVSNTQKKRLMTTKKITTKNIFNSFCKNRRVYSCSRFFFTFSLDSDKYACENQLSDVHSCRKMLDKGSGHRADGVYYPA